MAVNRKKEEAVVPRRTGFFWWFLANALALCFAVVSWLVLLHIFGNPEVPRNYGILKKLGRVPELKRYSVLNVPNGSGLRPSELYEKYFGMSDEKLVGLNSLLMRNYLHNFERSLLLTYVEGDYEVLEVRRLAEGDFIFPGFVIRARAMVKPDDFSEAVGYPVVLEYVFPTSDGAAAGDFAVGDVLEVSKSPNCAAVVHVSKAVVDGEAVLQLSVIPIAYGSYRIGEDRSFGIEPPEGLNVAAGLPIWR